jgi:hypothetical protein
MRTLCLLSLLAACGGDDSNSNIDAAHAIDAKPIDGAVTTNCTPSGSTGQVTVDGPSSTDPIQVTFVVQDPSGAVVSRSAVMGADATAMLDVPACGMVTVVDTGGSEAHAVTWMAVQPGDHLLHLNRLPTATPHALSVQLAAATGATEYQVLATCSPNHLSFTSSATATTVMLNPECTNASVSVLVTTIAPMGSQVSLMTVPLATSGTTNVAISGYQTPATSTLTAHSLGAFTDATYVTMLQQSGNQVSLGEASQPLANGAATVLAPMLAGAGGIEVELVSSVSGMPVHAEMVLRGEAAIPTSLDVTPADFLPTVDGSADTNARPTVTWSTSAPIAGALALVEVHSGTAQWNVITPPTPGGVHFPELPADLWPAATPSLQGVAVFESADVTTYAANNLATLLLTFPAAGKQVRLTTVQAASSARLTSTARAPRWSPLPSRW